ncbi:MAG: ferrous iron transport protein B [Proteobacteria bacterium]|nr:ferrous iron transport protein B [Pseudomonadota bacterium]MBU1736989.1 ferrous iron transport protein B [Pseudomonadota bacterium]
MPDQLNIALAGNPNAGKTTLFNRLTGARQHVGNYPGVTVEKKEGFFLAADGQRVKVVDLPGTYSLTAYSVEEVVARDYLVHEKPGVVVNITDAANLERHLYLTCQFLELGVPVVIALNMMDVARDRGITIDAEKLAALLNVPVVPISAKSGEGVEDLMAAALAVAASGKVWEPTMISYGDDLDGAIIEMEEVVRDHSFLTEIYTPRWLALKYLEGDEQIRKRGEEFGRKRGLENLATRLQQMVDRVAAHLMATIETYPEAMVADHRYGYIKSILRQGVVSQVFDQDRIYASDRIDRVVTSRVVGPLIMLGVLFGLYKITFTWSEIPVAWMEGLFELLSGLLDRLMTDGHLKSLMISGIVDGVGGVLGFVPLIMLMFFGIAILEDSGYLARVAFMMDRIFRIFGLHGSSVMSYILSGGIAGGCAVPGVMATRTLRSPKERMATLLTTPFMNCGAKIPVLALLIGTFFSENQAGFMFMLTLLAWIVALVVAKILRLTVLKGESTPFVMELPPYRFPTLKGLFIHTWEKTWQYIRKAGTVILGASILLWAMMTFPGLPDAEKQDFEKRRQQVITQIQGVENPGETTSLQKTGLEEKLAEINASEAERALLNSLAGRFGSGLETVSWLAGFDWRTNIALVGGFAAKEIIISTLGTAYSLGEVNPEESGSLSKTLAAEPAWSKLKALSLMLFIMFYSPCFVTVVCIVREAGSWKWGLFSMAFNTGFALLVAVVVYQVGTFLGLGV